MSALRGKRVFVVEDEALVLMTLEDILTEAGANIVGPAMDVPKGVALARTANIDIAILDMNIRGEAVDPVAEALRERNVPFIFATGYGQRAESHTKGAAVLDKPYLKEGLLHMLERCLAGPENV